MRRRFELLPISLYLAAQTGTGTGGAGNTDPQDPDPKDGGTGGSVEPPSKGMSQEEVDRIVAKRLVRERKTWETEAADKAAKDAMTETERLKAEKTTADAAAKAAVDKANSRVINAEAKVQAVDLGVRPDRIGAALRLADLADVTIGDDGEPDSKAIAKAVAEVVTQFPEWKVGATTSVGGGSNPANAGAGKGTTIDERYEAAEKSGNILQMIALKRMAQEAAQKR